MDGARSRPLWPSLIVLVGTVAIVVVVLLAVADRAPDPLAESAGAATSPPAPTVTPLVTPESTTDTTGPAASPPATSSPGTADDDPDVTASPTATVPDVSVDVLNETQVVGLAARAADALVESGWEVGLVDNSALGAPSSSVYVPEGLEAEAEQLTDAFPALSRTRPAFEGLDPARLTIVLAEPDAEFVVAAMEATTRTATDGLASASRSAPAADGLAAR